MKNIKRSFRSLLKKGEYNIVKICSLALGLSVGLILLAKVYFEDSYNQFYPDAEHIYTVFSNYGYANNPEEELTRYPQVSGATVIGIMSETPEVEAATRFTYIAKDATLVTDEKNKYKGTFILADSCFFDVFGIRILSGNPKTILNRPMSAMISRSLANKIGDQAIGTSFTLESRPTSPISIEGIFEDLPENSTYAYDVIISLSSIGNFTWDGSMNWMGNDRYRGFLKLSPNADLTRVQEGIKRMEQKYLPIKELEEAGERLEYGIQPLSELHESLPEVKRMKLLLSLLALALITTAVMNYLLVVVAGIINKTRELAIHKCYGASPFAIYRMALTEAGVHLIVSLGLCALLIGITKNFVETILHVSLKSLFLSSGIWQLLAICVGVFIVMGLIMGFLYIRIPVSNALRNYHKSKRTWKLSLLGIQFVAVGFTVTFLFSIAGQYNRMMKDNPGYEYDQLMYISLAGIDKNLQSKALTELERLPVVEQVANCMELPFRGTSGNNVRLPGENNDLFNVADFYFASDNIFETLGVPIIEGKTFTRTTGTSKEIMVDRNFVKRMEEVAGWQGSPIGKQVEVSYHSETSETSESAAFTICGVYENFRIGSITNQDKRPSVWFYNSTPISTFVIRVNDINEESTKMIHSKLEELFPTRNLELYIWKDEMEGLYIDTRHFRDAVIAGCLVILLISLIGLLGYIHDELNRRRKEIAIRKINGGTFRNIVGIFLHEIFHIALPALAVGLAFAIICSHKWMEDFSEKYTLPWSMLCGILILLSLLIASVLGWSVYRTSQANPVETLKSE